MTESTKHSPTHTEAIEASLAPFFRAPKGAKPLPVQPVEDATPAQPLATPSTPAGSASDDQSPLEGDVQRQPSLPSILPKELFSPRFLKNIQKQVDRWDAPTGIATADATRAKNIAVVARVEEGMSTYLKWTLGRAFTDLQGRLPRGTFTPYLTEACGMKRSTAYKYIDVAKAFKDPRVVSLIGFETAYAITQMALPQDLLDQLQDVSTADQVTAIIDTFQDDVAISSAWSNLNFDAVTTLGRARALELAHPPFCRPLREYLAQLPVDQHDAAIARYRELEIEAGGNGPLAVRILTNKAAPTAPADAVKASFKVTGLQQRVESLRLYEGLDLDAEDSALLATLEANLIELLQRVERRKANASIS